MGARSCKIKLCSLNSGHYQYSARAQRRLAATPPSAGAAAAAASQTPLSLTPGRMDDRERVGHTEFESVFLLLGKMSLLEGEVILRSAVIPTTSHLVLSWWPS